MTSATRSPGATAPPSPIRQVTSSVGSTWWKASRAQARPATTPARPAHHGHARPWWSAGTRAAVRSPSGSRSSARARATASTTAIRGGSRSTGRRAGPGGVHRAAPSRRHRPGGVAGPACTATPSASCTMRRRQRSDGVGVVAAGVGSPGLLADRGRGEHAAGGGDQVGQLACGPVGRGAVPHLGPERLDRRRAAGQRVGAPDDAGPLDHRPLQAVPGLGHRASWGPQWRARRPGWRATARPRTGPPARFGRGGGPPSPRSGRDRPPRPGWTRPAGPRTPCPRAASWRPAGWPRARRCRPPRRRPRGRAARWPPRGR